jgi:NhaA family Na+:H+ antiporter
MPIAFLKRRFVSYLQEFIHDSRAIGIILLVCTVASLLMANLGWGSTINSWLNAEIQWAHTLHLPHSGLHFINDGLMAVFFFLVGLEIKRELTTGELRTVKKALLPIAAAVGGMLAPALLYTFFNKGTNYQAGWGIPTATDIAFSLGVASMLGARFPASLKIFLTALAIIDDLGAILIIAFFYGGSIKGGYLLAAIAIFGLLLWAGSRRLKLGAWRYVAGLVMWYLVFNSGIHATIAGVLFAFTIPEEELPSLELTLHNWVNFGILPLFALANTFIVLNGAVLNQLSGSLSVGIMVGLVMGKPLGIFLACRVLVKRRIADLPRGVSWSQLLGAGILAGIGFTMSIFISGLAFARPDWGDISKIAILGSAVLSILLAVLWFQFVARPAAGRQRVASKR